ncbi:Limbic system-associated membrane protein [Echinococcus granulosus]|uniref:Limbic system-associated membrane protein n=2 Tax=Echinococcus granulosus TaxID=6210 RepID=W6VBY0_ECHGR|nr:Limbic system-associated membrane protein [Echinococcus granulosus]EUB64354.1 Limbic system-associated membrane protein [Echinococcus granulosus]
MARSRGCSPHRQRSDHRNADASSLSLGAVRKIIIYERDAEGLEICNEPTKRVWILVDESDKVTSGKVEEEVSLEGNKSEPLYGKTAFDHIKEALKIERRLNDVVLAVINTSTVLRCRPDKDFSNTDGQNGIKFIWRRLEEPTYLTFNHRRISQDKRYHVVMADFNEFKMDLRIERVMRSDEGEYICLYRGEKLVHEKHVYLKVLVLREHALVAVPSFINPNGSSNTRVVVREGLTQKLICNASGVPAPTIKWYMSTPDGKARRVITTKDQPRFLLSISVLIISNVTRDLRGTFTCVAYNGIEGKVSWNIHLDVYFRPVVKMSAEVIYRKPYQTTMIFATAVGNPIYSLYWEFDHKPIRSVNGDCFFTLSGDKYCVVSDREIANPMTVRTKLTIYNLTLEDYGTYTCVVHSPFGMERGSTELVREKEKRLDYLNPGETKFFPNLWNPLSWRNSQGEYVSRHTPRITTSGEPKKFSPLFLHIFMGISIYFSSTL